VPFASCQFAGAAHVPTELPTVRGLFDEWTNSSTNCRIVGVAGLLGSPSATGRRLDLSITVRGTRSDAERELGKTLGSAAFGPSGPARR
jgi:hypothetical protein